MPERCKGTVAKWLNHKGIGFITPAGKTEEGEDKNDILVHYGQIQQETKDGFRSLEQGSAVEYDLEEDPKNPEKKIAVNVTGEDGADCVPKTKSAKGKGKGKKGKGKGKGKRSRKGKGKGSKDDEDGEEGEEEEEAEE
jgi:CspA family cold shock protein